MEGKEFPKAQQANQDCAELIAALGQVGYAVVNLNRGYSKTDPDEFSGTIIIEIAPECRLS